MSTPMGAPGTQKLKAPTETTTKNPKTKEDASAASSTACSDSDASFTTEKTRKKKDDYIIIIQTTKAWCSTCLDLHNKTKAPCDREKLRQDAIKHIKQQHPTGKTLTKQQAPPTFRRPASENTEMQVMQNHPQTYVKPAVNTENLERMETEEGSKKRPLDQEIEPQQRQLSKFARIFQERPPVPTRNKFDPLKNLDQEQDARTPNETDDDASVSESIRSKASRSINNTRHIQQKQQKTTTGAAPKKNANKPPPIIIKGVALNKETYQDLTNALKIHAKSGYKIKYTKNTTIVYIENLEEYKNYKQTLNRDETVQWHTYATEDERTHAFVLKGLDHTPEPEELKTELQETYKIKIKEIYKMKTLYRPMYLVITMADHTLKQLQQQVKYLNFVHVSWERRHNTKPIIQCRRCCLWGHGQTNCHRWPKCLKCAGDHTISNCDQNQQDKCANCKQDHRADSENCDVYKYKLSILQRQQTPKPQYIPAPTPKSNPWTRNQQARANGPTGATRANSGRIPERETQRPTPRTRIRSENIDSDMENEDFLEENFPRLPGTQKRDEGPAPKISQQQAGKSVTGFMHAVGRLQDAFDLTDLCRFINDFADIKVKYPNKMERGFAIIEFITNNIHNYNI